LAISLYSLKQSNNLIIGLSDPSLSSSNILLHQNKIT
jgi:hypothetical protein